MGDLLKLIWYAGLAVPVARSLAPRRREFTASLGAVARSMVAQAQQGEPVRWIGVLTNGTDTEALTTLMIRLLRNELQKLGWIEDRNLRLDFRFGGCLDENVFGCRQWQTLVWPHQRLIHASLDRCLSRQQHGQAFGPAV